MNILIVDDEILAIENVENALKNISFPDTRGRNVFRAFNINDAKSIIATENIDILLCDIEMPNGNGIDLVRWLYESGYHMECIMITCYADFNYIKNAMKYGVTGYILKPVDIQEFESVICQAYKNLAIRNSEIRRKMEHYVSALLMGTAVEYTEADKELQKTGRQKEDYWGIFLSVKYRPLEFCDWDKKSTCFVLSNIANEILEIKEDDCPIILNEFQQVFFVNRNNKNDKKALEEKCNQLIHWFFREEGWRLNLYLTDCKRLEAAIKDINDVMEKDKDYESFGTCKCYPFHSHYEKSEFSETRQMFMLLLEEDKYGETRKLLEKIRDNYEKTRQGITRFSKNEMLDLLQVFYGKLGKKHLLISELVDEKGKKLYRNLTHTNSMEAFFEYIDYLLCLLEKNSECVIDTGEVCKQLKDYIQKNVDHVLTREELSNYAHLNADYLNRIFKKQNGESLMSYVVRTKMEKAKQLMNETQLNITQISEMVGYDNYSYFATCFKKYEGISAKQYRENRK